MRETQQRRAPVRIPVVKRGAGADEPGLSHRRIQDLAEQYQERAYANALANDGDTRTAELDADLRRRLGEMALPEFVEIEFERVMAEVCRSDRAGRPPVTDGA
jgi:hypothetical protein